MPKLPKLVEWALIASALGFALSIPCLVNTTPITMVLFFFVSVPMLGLGFLLYLIAVVRDLRSHGVL
jgi:hypothetical protein